MNTGRNENCIASPTFRKHEKPPEKQKSENFAPFRQFRLNEQRKKRKTSDDFRACPDDTPTPNKKQFRNSRSTRQADDDCISLYAESLTYQSRKDDEEMPKMIGHFQNVCQRYMQFGACFSESTCTNLHRFDEAKLIDSISVKDVRLVYRQLFSWAVHEDKFYMFEKFFPFVVQKLGTEKNILLITEVLKDIVTAEKFTPSNKFAFVEQIFHVLVEKFDRQFPVAVTTLCFSCQLPERFVSVLVDILMTLLFKRDLTDAEIWQTVVTIFQNYRVDSGHVETLLTACCCVPDKRFCRKVYGDVLPHVRVNLLKRRTVLDYAAVLSSFDLKEEANAFIERFATDDALTETRSKSGRSEVRQTATKTNLEQNDEENVNDTLSVKLTTAVDLESNCGDDSVDNLPPPSKSKSDRGDDRSDRERSKRADVRFNILENKLVGSTVCKKDDADQKTETIFKDLKRILFTKNAAQMKILLTKCASDSDRMKFIADCFKLLLSNLKLDVYTFLHFFLEREGEKHLPTLAANVLLLFACRERRNGARKIMKYVKNYKYFNAVSVFFVNNWTKSTLYLTIIELSIREGKVDFSKKMLREELFQSDEETWIYPYGPDDVQLRNKILQKIKEIAFNNDVENSTAYINDALKDVIKHRDVEKFHNIADKFSTWHKCCSPDVVRGIVIFLMQNNRDYKICVDLYQRVSELGIYSTLGKVPDVFLSNKLNPEEIKFVLDLWMYSIVYLKLKNLIDPNQPLTVTLMMDASHHLSADMPKNIVKPFADVESFADSVASIITNLTSPAITATRTTQKFFIHQDEIMKYVRTSTKPYRNHQ